MAKKSGIEMNLPTADSLFTTQEERDEAKRESVREKAEGGYEMVAGHRRKMASELAQQSEDSVTQIKRYIRLTELIPSILDMVDENKVAMRLAVEISYLPKKEQESLFDTMEAEDCTPSHAQAIKMRKFSEEGKLGEDVILSILTEEKPNQVEQFKIPKKRIEKYTRQSVLYPS